MIVGKRITWRDGDFIALKLRDDLFTAARMERQAEMCFFNIFQSHDDWSNVDWDGVLPIFHGFVGSVVLKRLGYRKLDVTGSILGCRPQDLWIKSYSIFDPGHFEGDIESFPMLGGRLIDLRGGMFDTNSAPVVKHDLKVLQDRQQIERYELVNMWGDLDLTDRLIRYHETGINRDDLKFEVFPGLWDDREKLRPLTRRLPAPFR
ncbi:hypothetical protein ABFE88_22460 [Pseudomonas sichuanensis]|uniref:Uncharacterized protein n=1 Tax=Pseudomonas sichuanensis TaxID=2213015 RepID=A0ABV0DKP0_9PSED